MSKIDKIKVNNTTYDVGADYSNIANTPDLTQKQDKLVSGTNIKTINNQSLLGSGNINIEGGGGGTSELSTDVKNAILDCFEHVAWTDANGQTYYDALEDLFFPPKTLASISAVFNQGSTVIYDNASLDDLKQYLTVTANYDDETTETITNYSLSGTLTAGTSTITVTYEGKTTTFNVIVTATPTLSSITATYTQSGAVYTSDSLDSLKTNLVVKAIYTDSSEVTLQDSDYTLSGTLSVGTSTITVSYSGKTTTFNVTVSQSVELSSISAVYTQSETIYTSDNINDLKDDLVVTATYTDSSTRTISASDYTLSGSLTAGTSTITVTYSGKTTTFNVTVTAVVVTSIDAVFTQGSATITTDNSLNDLKQYLVVTASYNNGTTSTVASADYTLSGTLTVGTSTITVTYEGLTDTFTVTVSQAEQWDYSWVASTSNQTLPTSMTYYSGYTPVWGSNNEYVEVKDPRLQGGTNTTLVGNITVEVEMAWSEQGAYSAGTTLAASSAAKTGCKLFLANNSGNINLYSCAEEGGNYTLKTIGTDWSNFHKYRFELVGTLCKTYIDGTLVDTGYTYYSSWNGYPIIWSENQGSGRATIKFKSIKYRIPSST